MTQPREEPRLGEVVNTVYASPRMTRRMYLALRAMEGGADLFTAAEAVASTALAHPEWNLDEEKTWTEWEQEERAM